MLRVTKQVHIGLSEIIYNNLEDFLDILAERAGYPMLMDIHYHMVSLLDEDTLLIMVEGENGDEACDDCGQIVEGDHSCPAHVF